MAKKPYIHKDDREKMEAARQEIIAETMANKEMPAELKEFICSMSLKQMLMFMGVETQKPKSEDANAPITFLPAITRTPNIKMRKGVMGTYETLTPAVIYFVQDSRLDGYYFNIYFLRDKQESFKIACCLGDVIDGVYGRNMKYMKELEELPPSKRRISPTLYNRINKTSTKMIYETGYINSVNFGQGKEWFALLDVEDKNGENLWAKLRLHGPLQMDMDLTLKVAHVVTLVGDIIMEITKSEDIPAITKMNNYLGWDLCEQHFWK